MPTGAGLGEKMCQLMPQGAIDLGMSMGSQPAIEQNARVRELCPARSRTQAARPLDDDPIGKRFGAMSLQQNAGDRFELGIAAWSFRRNERGEQEFKLASGKDAHQA